MIVGRLARRHGRMISRLKKVASHRDDLIVEERGRSGKVERARGARIAGIGEHQGAQGPNEVKDQSKGCARNARAPFLHLFKAETTGLVKGL